MGLSGATGGAQTGYTLGGGGGALLGGILGGGAGALGGFLDSQSQEQADELNLQEQGLNNDLMQQQLQAAKRKNRNDQTGENGFNLFRGFLGAAFKSGQPSTFGGALKAYPGLGNQGVP